MKEYAVHSITNSSTYKVLIMCLTHQSIALHIQEISQNPMILTQEGTLLIDQLLVTGNGANRYIGCHFSHGNIDIKTMHNVVPTQKEKMMSMEILNKHYDMLQHSILTDEQRYALLQNHPI